MWSPDGGEGGRKGPWNKDEIDNHNRIKEKLKAEENEKRDAENARRANMGLKPCEHRYV